MLEPYTVVDCDNVVAYTYGELSVFMREKKRIANVRGYPGNFVVTLPSARLEFETCDQVLALIRLLAAIPQ